MATVAARRPRVVLLGTGWGANKVARALDKELFDVRVVSPTNHFLFTPLLPSTTVGTLEFRAVQEPVRTVPGLGEYYQAKAKALDLAARTVRCQDVFKDSEFSLDFDYLVIGTGCRTNTFGVPGVLERQGKEVFFLKQLSHARQIRQRILECFERAALPGTSLEERRRLLSFVVVGGGPTSCEFTTELYDFISNDVARWFPDLADDISMTLVEAGPRLLGTFDQALVDYVTSFLLQRNVAIRTDVSVVAVQETEIEGHHSTTAVLGDGTQIPFGMMVWSAGLEPVELVKQCNLPLHSNGRLQIDGFLRVQGTGGRVFALGDCAMNEDHPLPPLASVAEQQGAYLSECFNQSYKDQDPDQLGDLDDDCGSTLPPPAPVPPAAWPPYPTFLFQPSSTFRYITKGSMVGLGMGEAVADMTKADLAGPPITGFMAFVMWRGYYFSRQFSWSNMILVPMFWFKSAVFGRDISRF